MEQGHEPAPLLVNAVCWKKANHCTTILVKYRSSIVCLVSVVPVRAAQFESVICQAMEESRGPGDTTTRQSRSIASATLLQSVVMNHCRSVQVGDPDDMSMGGSESDFNEQLNFAKSLSFGLAV